MVKPRTILAHPTAAVGSPNALFAFGFAAHEAVKVYWRSAGPGGTLLGTITTNASGSAILAFATPSSVPAAYNLLSMGQAKGGIATLVLAP